MKNAVVITTYNGEKYIVEQLDSIKNQTLPPDEVIIRDDCSIDSTAQIIREYIVKYNLENWDFRVNAINKGFFDNFMDAIRECTGEIIYLADQDDVWDKRKIETFTKFYERHKNTTMIQSYMRYIDGNGDELPLSELYHGKEKSIDPVQLTIEDMFRFAGSGYTMSFRKIVSEKIFAEGFNKKKDIFTFHDILLGQTSAVLGNCYLMTNIVDSHRLHSSNETQQNGKSYLANRTRKAQISILKCRVLQCKNMLKICNNRKKELFIKEFAKFTENRMQLIESKKIKYIPQLICRIKYYASKKGIVTDLMYAIGMEKALLTVYKKM